MYMYKARRRRIVDLDGVVTIASLYDGVRVLRTTHVRRTCGVPVPGPGPGPGPAATESGCHVMAHARTRACACRRGQQLQIDNQPRIAIGLRGEGGPLQRRLEDPVRRAT